MPYDLHPLCTLLPPMSDEEMTGLVADIGANGQREPITLLENGQVIDGRNRLTACAKLGIEPIVTTLILPDTQLLTWVLGRNIKRRFLSTSQRAAVAAKIADITPSEAASLGGKAKARGKGTVGANLIGKMTTHQAANALSVSDTIVEQCKAVMKHLPHLYPMILSGEMTVGAAYLEVTGTPQTAPQAALSGKKGPKAAPKPKGLSLPALLAALAKDAMMPNDTGGRFIRSGGKWHGVAVFYDDAAGHWVTMRCDEITPPVSPGEADQSFPASIMIDLVLGGDDGK